MVTDTSSLCHRTKHHKPHLLFLIFLLHVLCWQAYQIYNWEPPFSVNNMAAVSFLFCSKHSKTRYSMEYKCNYACKHIFGGIMIYASHLILKIWQLKTKLDINEPRHEISNKVVCATSKTSHQETLQSLTAYQHMTS